MNKHQIIAEIKRIAADNGGRPPGMQAFGRATAVRKGDWFPHIWLRWSGALVEAGYSPNAFSTKTSDKCLIEKYLALVRELGRFPVEGEILRKARSDPSFPNPKTYARFGGKQKLISALAEYCRDHEIRASLHDWPHELDWPSRK